jgi:hypothetical protein
MSEADEHPWTFKRPERTAPGPRKASPGGYTKPDYTVRCRACGVGKDEAGAMIGTPLGTYIVSMGLPDNEDGTKQGSVAIARVPMCYKCRDIRPFDILPAADQYGIKGSDITRCLKARKGPLAMPWFTLEELLIGKVTQTELPPDLVERPKAIERVTRVDPADMGLVQEAIF